MEDTCEYVSCRYKVKDTVRLYFMNEEGKFEHVLAVKNPNELYFKTKNGEFVGEYDFKNNDI